MDMKDFVSYETAKKLKAAGFNEPCSYYYTSYDGLKGNIQESCNGDGNFNAIITDLCAIKCSAPTLYHTQKWLREVKGIEVSVAWCRNRKSYYYWYGELACHDENVRFEFDFPSYESALSAGIDAALDLITNKTE